MSNARVERAEDLYALPLDEFISARDELAKRLRDEGDEAGARDVKALRKPSLPAWAVNQLARAEAEDVRRLFELRDEIAGASGAAELRRLTEQRRRVLAGLLARAEEVLVTAGHSAAAATTDAISKTLQAGGSDEERALIESGTLDRPLTPTGFEGLGGFEFGTDFGEDEPAESRPSAAARRTAERLDAEAREAEIEARDLSAAAEAATREAEELARRAEKARRRAEKARQKADAALDEL